MNWTPKVAESGNAFWEARSPLGEFVVDFSPRLNKNKPWCVTWYPVGLSGEITIGFRADDRAARRLAEGWQSRFVTVAARMAQ